MMFKLITDQVEEISLALDMKLVHLGITFSIVRKHLIVKGTFHSEKDKDSRPPRLLQRLRTYDSPIMSRIKPTYGKSTA